MASWSCQASALFIILTDALEVSWHMSNAWQDESCDDVCGAAALYCTEECWPATVAGLRTALQQPAVKSACFTVEGGPPLIWNPAKDPDNTVCYWNPGTSSGRRCPIVPSTSSDLAAAGRFIRRICPCINTTAPTSLQCGLGGQAAAEAPRGNAIAMTTSPGASAMSTTPLNSANSRSTTICQTLCVSGFNGVDSRLNGEYARKPAGYSNLSHWQGAGIELSLSSLRKWRFLQVTGASTSQSIAQGTLTTSGNVEIPQNDFFMTATGGHQVSFQCCTLGTTALPQYSLLQQLRDTSPPTSNKGNGIDNTLVGVIVAFVVLAVVFTVAMVMKRRGSYLAQPREYLNMETPGKDAAVNMEAGHGHHSSKQAIPAVVRNQAQADGRLSTTLPKTSWRGQNPQSSPSLGHATKSCMGNSTGNHAGDELAAVLGRAASNPVGNGTYEGPSQPWWGGSEDPQKTASKDSRTFLVGARVRLHGLVSNATWNGSEGTVESYDKAIDRIHIRLADGRVKAVRAENCQSISPRADGKANEANHDFSIYSMSNVSGDPSGIYSNSSLKDGWPVEPPGTHHENQSTTGSLLRAAGGGWRQKPIQSDSGNTVAGNKPSSMTNASFQDTRVSRVAAGAPPALPPISKSGGPPPRLPALPQDLPLSPTRKASTVNVNGNSAVRGTTAVPRESGAGRGLKNLQQPRLPPVTAVPTLQDACSRTPERESHAASPAGKLDHPTPNRTSDLEAELLRAQRRVQTQLDSVKSRINYQRFA